MKIIGFCLVVGMLFSSLVGCTRIVSIEPSSGPPGTPVYVKCEGMFGSPCCRTLKWDGDTICDSFPGSFVIPAINDGGDAGEHKITLIDDLDVDEAFLIFPIFRLRHDTATFLVKGQ